MKKLYLIHLLRPIFHIILIILAFFFIYKLRLYTDLIPFVQLPMPQIDYTETMAFGLLAALLFPFIGMIKRLYSWTSISQRYFLKFSKVWIYWIISITFISYFGAGFIFSYSISRFIVIFAVIISFILLFIFDQIRNLVENSIFKKSFRKVLIVGGLDIDKTLLNDIKSTFGMRTEFAQVDEFSDLDLTEYYAMLVLGKFSKNKLQDIFEKIRFHDTRLFHISDGMFLEDVVYKPEYISHTIAIEYTHSKLDGRSRIFKRLFDIVGSFIAIVLLSPLFLLLAILIKLDSKGPVFFIQKRVGKGGKLFTFLKFRTMYTHLSTGDGYGGKEAEALYKKLIDSKQNVRAGILPKIQDDPRVTKIGKFLRKTSLDELPQLFCALIGTMSLIGPRPHLPREVENYALRQKRLLSINPGITGYAQVFGRDNLDFKQEAKLDLYYIQNRSIFMDLYIVFMTFKVVFRGK